LHFAACTGPGRSACILCGRCAAAGGKKGPSAALAGGQLPSAAADISSYSRPLRPLLHRHLAHTSCACCCRQRKHPNSSCCHLCV